LARDDLSSVEGWQNGYCTSLENWRPQGLGGSNPSPSVVLIARVIGLVSSLRRQPKILAHPRARDPRDHVVETLRPVTVVDPPQPTLEVSPKRLELGSAIRMCTSLLRPGICPHVCIMGQAMRQPGDSF
jgi:hypothetical protein